MKICKIICLSCNEEGSIYGFAIYGGESVQLTFYCNNKKCKEYEVEKHIKGDGSAD